MDCLKTKYIMLHDTSEDAHKLSARGRTITTYAFSPNGQHLVSAHEDNDTKRYKHHFLQIWQVHKGIEVRTIYINHNASPRRCEYSADGKHILVSFRDGTLKIWDTDADEEPRSFRPHFNQSIIFVVSKDVRYVLTSGCGPNNQPEIKLWDFKTLSLLGMVTVSESPDALALRPTGLLVTIGEKNKMTFFRVHSPFESPIVTPVNLYCPELGRFVLQKTVRCEWCGFRFVVPPHILKTILKLKVSSQKFDKTDSLQSPSPNKQAWDKSQLTYNCLHCNKIVRINPFYFDNERIDK
jgi:DNA-directed RNA polymerase subunit RPC12/RpoP